MREVLVEAKGVLKRLGRSLMMVASKDLKSENFTGNLRRGDSCYTMAESLAILSPTVMHKIENTPDELSDLTKIWSKH